MSTQLHIGQKGENTAQVYLRKKGYEILERNWRYRRAEVDIIAKKEDALIFVEVKTRSSDYYGSPEDFVSKKKMKFITQAASAYMEMINHTWEVRFDIVSVVIKNGLVVHIDHLEDAFFFGLK